jgi:hypothetical protein
MLDVPHVEGLGTIDLNGFVGRDWTDAGLRKIWIKNYLKNKLNIINRESKQRFDNNCCVLVGSSPSVQNQIKALKRVACLKNFKIIACNGIYKWLLKNDIIPDYVFLVEGRSHVLSDINKPNDKTTLVVSPFVDPEVFNIWRDNIEVYICGGGDDFDEIIRKDYDDLNITGGNVVNTSFLWAYRYLGCRDFIATGVALSYKNDYYFDNRSTEHVMGDNIHTVHAVDMYGDVVKTTTPLLLYKVWLETYSRISGADFVNATEEGILGVYPEPTAYEDGNISGRVKYLPWMSIAPLELAIDAYNNKLEDNNE